MRLTSRAEARLRAPRRRSEAAWSQPASLHWNGPTVTVGGKPTWPHDRCAQLVRGIQNFHMDGRGWADIAYNYVVCPHRVVFEGRGPGVTNGANGTTAGNRSSPAIMVLAGPGNPFSLDEKDGILDVRDHLVATTRTRPGLLGHRDHKATDCPGNERYAWLRSNPTQTPTTLSEDAMYALIKDTYDHWGQDARADFAGLRFWLRHGAALGDEEKLLVDLTGALAHAAGFR